MTCQVLDLCRQACHRQPEAPVTDYAESDYLLPADEARDAGQPMADRTAWRICSTNR